MLRQIRERIKLVKNILLTIKNFLISIPVFIWHKIRAFYYIFTLDYDIGHAILHSWIIWSIYLSCQLLSAYTSFFELIPDVFFGSVDFCVYSFEYGVSVAVQFWLPCIVATTVITSVVYYDYKEKKEKYELMQSYIDDEDDMVAWWDTIEPVHGARPLWGERDEDIEPVRNFTAPTVYLKISGIVGRYRNLEERDIVLRVNQAIKNKLAPEVTNGRYPWARMSVVTQVSLVYIQFKTIEEATKCFKTLDGLTFDGVFLGNCSPDLHLQTCIAFITILLRTSRIRVVTFWSFVFSARNRLNSLSRAENKLQKVIIRLLEVTEDFENVIINFKTCSPFGWYFVVAHISSLRRQVMLSVSPRL